MTDDLKTQPDAADAALEAWSAPTAEMFSIETTSHVLDGTAGDDGSGGANCNS